MQQVQDQRAVKKNIRETKRRQRNYEPTESEIKAYREARLNNKNGESYRKRMDRYNNMSESDKIKTEHIGMGPYMGLFDDQNDPEIRHNYYISTLI